MRIVLENLFKLTMLIQINEEQRNKIQFDDDLKNSLSLQYLL
jgi:hypothetical protein